MGLHGLIYTVSSDDIFSDIFKGELYIGSNKKDKTTRLGNHIMQQKCLYPVFPPIYAKIIDYSKRELLDIVTEPSFLISSSCIKPFTKIIENMMFNKSKNHESLSQILHRSTSKKKN